MFPKSRILCVGHDAMLLQTRKWMLEGEFEVETAETAAQALVLLEMVGRPFDLVLLCHSLNDQECKLLCDAVFSQSTAIRVLQLNEGWRDIRSLTGPQEQISAARPQTLIEKIAELTRRAQGTRSGPTDLSETR